MNAAMVSKRLAVCAVLLVSACTVLQWRLDLAAETVVLCHHGVRSMNAAMVSAC